MATQVNEGAAPAAEKKGPPMMIILVIAIVFSVIGSLLLAKMMFGGKSASAKPEKVEVGVSVALDEFLTNLADPPGDRYVKTTIALGLKKGLVEDDIKDKVPAIRDAVLTVLKGEHMADIADANGMTRLKKVLVTKINAVTDDDKGKDKVVEVYFQAFATQ